MTKTFRDYDRQLTEDIKSDIIRWIILASFEGRYTGQLETQLQEDLQAINNRAIDGLLNNLYTKNLPRDVLEDDYDNKHIGLLSILYTLNGARDWYITGSLQPKQIKELLSKDIHIHHIFPKKYLKHAYKGEYSEDDIGNITLISKEANEEIKDENPNIYLKKLYDIDHHLLDKHFIPSNNELWTADNYDKFLEVRRENIANAIREMLNINVEE